MVVLVAVVMMKVAGINARKGVLMKVAGIGILGVTDGVKGAELKGLQVMGKLKAINEMLESRAIPHHCSR